MSRPERKLQKRFVVFCEGDTEYNYIDKMRKSQSANFALWLFKFCTLALILITLDCFWIQFCRDCVGEGVENEAYGRCESSNPRFECAEFGFVYEKLENGFKDAVTVYFRERPEE